MPSFSTTTKTQAKEFDWINNTDPLERINHLSDLQENWDGYSAPRFSENHLVRARTILLYFAIERLPHIATLHNMKSRSITKDKIINKLTTQDKPFVVPCSDGSILFEWSGKRFPDKQLEIFIPADENKPIEYLKSSEHGEEEGTIEQFLMSKKFPKEFKKLIDWLFS